MCSPRSRTSSATSPTDSVVVLGAAGQAVAVHRARGPAAAPDVGDAARRAVDTCCASCGASRRPPSCSSGSARTTGSRPAVLAVRDACARRRAATCWRCCGPRAAGTGPTCAPTRPAARPRAPRTTRRRARSRHSGRSPAGSCCPTARPTSDSSSRCGGLARLAMAQATDAGRRPADRPARPPDRRGAAERELLTRRARRSIDAALQAGPAEPPMDDDDVAWLTVLLGSDRSATAAWDQIAAGPDHAPRLHRALWLDVMRRAERGPAGRRRRRCSPSRPGGAATAHLARLALDHGAGSGAGLWPGPAPVRRALANGLPPAELRRRSAAAGQAGDPVGVRVNVHRRAAQEADEGEPGLLGQVDRERARRGHRGEHRHARPSTPSGPARSWPGR